MGGIVGAFSLQYVDVPFTFALGGLVKLVAAVLVLFLEGKEQVAVELPMLAGKDAEPEKGGASEVALVEAGFGVQELDFQSRSGALESAGGETDLIRRRRVELGEEESRGANAV